MNQSKRRLTDDHLDDGSKRHSNVDATKKCSTCIEDLSNEILLEIFDYFDGYELYKIFWNLNSRFHNLIAGSSFSLKIGYYYCGSTESLDYCKNFILPNRDRIIALDLQLRSFSTSLFELMSPIDSSFQRLESLHLLPIQSKDLIHHLETFRSLPRLFSLYLPIFDSFSLDLGRIYELVFRLPVLKRVTLSPMVKHPTISLRLDTTHQSSTIEYMFMAHTCSINELMIVISYTPQLRKLICQKILKSNEDMPLNMPSTLSTLRYLSVQNCAMKFDEFEPLLTQICSPLRILRVNANDDSAYLDADRWERLISQRMVNLHRFYFSHSKAFLDHRQIHEHHTLVNGFISSFRRQQQWTIKLSSVIDKDGRQNIIYSIGPKKKAWYNLPDLIENDRYVNQNSQARDELSTKPEITAKLFIQRLNVRAVRSLFSFIPITVLHTGYDVITAEMMLDFINQLPNLEALRIEHFRPTKSTYSSLKKTKAFSTAQHNNKITKVSLKCVDKLDELQLFLDLCPSLTYVGVDCGRDYKLFVEFFLTQNCAEKPCLRTIGLTVPPIAIDEAVEDIKQMIDSEKLVDQYTIKYVNHRLFYWLYLQWK